MASFTVAALTGAAAIAVISQLRSWREFPIASFPLLFSIQQAVEGSLWLVLAAPGEAACARPLAVTFVLAAQVIWPGLAPAAILLIETRPKRKLILACSSLAGLAVACTSLLALIENPLSASVVKGSIRYANDFPYYGWWPALYALATAIPPLISSHGAIRSFGLIVLAGYAVSAYFYEQTLTSVWCFFAAAASLALVFYFPGPARAGQRIMALLRL